MCLLHLVFDTVRGKCDNEIIKLSSVLKTELFSCAMLCSLLWANWRAEGCSKLYAADASGWGVAVVSANVGKFASLHLSRTTQQKGSWSKLMGSVDSLHRKNGLIEPNAGVLGAGHIECFDVFRQLSQCLQFSTELAKPYRSQKNRPHINIGEVRAHLQPELLLAREESSVRGACVGDSSVSTGCLAKGRSSSGLINLELASGLGVVVSEGLYLGSSRVRILYNVADDLTRGKKCRNPCVDVPDWFSRLTAGDADGLMDIVEKAEFATDPEVPIVNEATLCATDREPACAKARSICVRKALNAGVPIKKALRKIDDKSAKFGKIKPANLAERSGTIINRLPRRCFVLSRHARLSDGLVGQGFLEFGGCNTSLASACIRRGRGWAVFVTNNFCDNNDVLSKDFQNILIELIESGAFYGIGISSIDSSFSCAYTPAIRSSCQPCGREPDGGKFSDKLRRGNCIADFYAKVIELAKTNGIPLSVSNPIGSYVWQHLTFAKAVEGLGETIFDLCQFGMKWQKRSMIKSNIKLID